MKKPTICSYCGTEAEADHQACKEKDDYNMRHCRRKGKNRYQGGKRMIKHN